MIFTGTADKARQTRRCLQIPGTESYYKSEWMDTGHDPKLSPTVFLVEMAPGSSVDTHFHRNNQFQLFLKGSGSIGKHGLEPVSIHYAGAFTGYGPLVAGAEGLWYFTMRSVCESGALFIPQSVDQMVRGPKRQVSSAGLATARPSELAALTRPESMHPIPVQSDGLAASVSRIPPRGSFVGGSPKGTGGQFYVVLEGSMLHQGSELGQWEHIFLTEDEAAYEVTAGGKGLQVLCLQFAPKAPEYLVAAAQAPNDSATQGVPTPV